MMSVSDCAQDGGPTTKETAPISIIDAFAINIVCARATVNNGFNNAHSTFIVIVFESQN